MFALSHALACGARSSESTGGELLGYRAIVRAPGGLVRELDAGALPTFRIPAIEQTEISEAIMQTERGSFSFPIISTERRGDSMILRTGAPSSPKLGQGELRFGDRAWPAAWIGRPNAELATMADQGKETELRALAAKLEGRARFDALNALAKAVRRRGDCDASVEALLAAASAAESAGMLSETTRLQRAAAYAYIYARRFQEAEPLLARAEALDATIGNTSGLLRAAHYRSHILIELGRYRSAKQLLSQAIARADAYGLDFDRTTLERSLASLFSDLGQHEEALRIFRAVGAEFLKASPLERIGYLIDLGWTELRAIEAGAVARSYDEPRRHLEEAIALAKSAGAALEETNALTNLLWIAHLERDDMRSEALLRELSDRPSVESSYARLFVRFARANLLLRRHRAADAVQELEELRRLAMIEAGGGSSDYLWRATYAIGQASLELGDRPNAEARFAEAIEQLDRLAKETELSRSTALFFQDRKQLYDDAAELAIESGHLASALSISDRARTHVLRSLQAKIGADQLDAAKVAEYSELRARYEQRAERAGLVDPTARNEFDLDTTRMRGQLIELFDAAYGDVDADADQRELTAARMSEVLGDDSALIVFAAIGERTDAFSVYGNRVDHRRDVRGSSSALSAWPGRPNALRHLYVVAGGRVRVRDVLEELAHTPAVLENTSISFLSHAGALFMKHAPASRAPLVIADPDASLPGAAREGSWVATKLNTRALRARAATRESALAQLSGASVFHFAGHGVLEPAQPFDAHLMLASGETLSLEDLLVARPTVGVVVLSGCSTGETAPLSASERIGLPEAFLFAGARAVVATTGAINDAAAFGFVRRFYEAGGSKNPIEAWRRAALESISAGDETWKSFYVLGRKES